MKARRALIASCSGNGPGPCEPRGRRWASRAGHSPMSPQLSPELSQSSTRVRTSGSLPADSTAVRKASNAA